MNNIKDRLREIANERPYLRHGLIEVDRSLVHDAVDRIAELEGELARVREKYRIVREALVEGRTQAERNSALVLATVEPSALLAENGRLRKCIEELEAERDEWQSRAAQLARIGQATVKAIIDAHMKAFGPPRNYEYVDTQTTIDLLVADIGATQHERDRLIAENARLTNERDEYAEKFTTFYHFQATYNESKRCWDLVARSNDLLLAERDQLREQLAAEREYSAGLRKVIENKNQDARAK